MLLDQRFVKNRPIKTIFSLFLALTVAGESVAASPRAAKKFPRDKGKINRPVDDALLFETLGSLGGVTERDPAVGRARGVVVHLLDIHGDETAQRGLGKALEAAAGAGAELIGLEGAFAPLDIAGFLEAVDPTVRRATADFLLKENRITGPLHAALAAALPFPPMEGVDDLPLYRRNVDAARRAAQERPATVRRAGAAMAALSAEQERVCNPALRALDRAVRAAESDPKKWVEALRALVNVAGDRATPNVQAFLRAADSPGDAPRAAAEARRLATLIGPALSPRRAGGSVGTGGVGVGAASPHAVRAGVHPGKRSAAPGGPRGASRGVGRNPRTRPLGRIPPIGGAGHRPFGADRRGESSCPSGKGSSPLRRLGRTASVPVGLVGVQTPAWRRGF